MIEGTEVWSVGMACSELVECVLRNKREIHPVTVNVKGHYGVQADLFLAVPAVIGEHGVSHLITGNFDDDFSKLAENIAMLVREKLPGI